MTKAKPEPEKTSLLKSLGENLFAIGFVAAIVVGWMFVVIGCYEIYHYGSAAYYEYFPAKPDPLTPGELVDRAMKESGAIVISPHKDMRQVLGIPEYRVVPGLNISTYNEYVHTAAPAIAVHTKHYWCIWSLGQHTGFDGNGNEMSAGFVQGGEYAIVSNGDGFQNGYDAFEKCIAEGK